MVFAIPLPRHVDEQQQITSRQMLLIRGVTAFSHRPELAILRSLLVCVYRLFLLLGHIVAWEECYVMAVTPGLSSRPIDCDVI